MIPPHASPLEAALAVTVAGLLFALAVPTSWFAVQYGFGSQWRATPTGRALFWSTTSFAAVVDLSVVFALLGVHRGAWAYLVGVVAYAWLNVAAWGMVRTLWRAQRDDRKTRQQPGPLDAGRNRR